MAMAVANALGHVANVGQFVESGQAHAHQKEQIRWTRRSYMLDVQNMRLDLLVHAKDEIRAHYDIYVGRLDTFLKVNALLMTFGLASLQFTGPFFLESTICNGPPYEKPCPTMESKSPWVVTLWAWMVGLVLILPFWSILMLIRSKLKLDSWLERSLQSLNRERQITINAASAARGTVNERSEEQVHTEMEAVVNRLGKFIVVYQYEFARIWNIECGGLVKLSQRLIFLTMTIGIALVALMFWLYLANRRYVAKDHFFAICIVGFIVPFFFIVCSIYSEDAVPKWTAEREAAEESGYHEFMRMTSQASFGDLPMRTDSNTGLDMPVRRISGADVPSRRMSERIDFVRD